MCEDVLAATAWRDTEAIFWHLIGKRHYAKRQGVDLVYISAVFCLDFGGTSWARELLMLLYYS